MRALSLKWGLPLNLGCATVFRGHALLAAAGRGEEGLAEINRDGDNQGHGRDYRRARTCLMLLARAYGGLGRREEEAQCLADAEDLMATTDERYKEAELHRLRGDALRAVGRAEAAEALLSQALAVARAQSARLFELRAAIGLAKLWRSQGRGGEARRLLRPSTKVRRRLRDARCGKRRRSWRRSADGLSLGSALRRPGCGR